MAHNTEEWSAKFRLLKKGERNPAFRWLVSRVLAPSYFLTFFKTMEDGFVSRYLEARPGDVVGDLACGTGERSVWLARKACISYSIDLDRKSITAAQRLFASTGTYAQADGERLPFKSGAFDKVLSVCALEHFKHEDDALREASRILRPGGLLVVTVDSLKYQGLDPRLIERHKVNNYVSKYYSREDLQAAIERNGFRVEEAQYFVSSPISAFFFNLWIKRVWLCSLLYPAAVVLSQIGDRFWGRPDQGYLLAMKARKV